MRALIWLTDLLKPLGKFSLIDRIPTKCYYRFVKRFDCVSPIVDVNEGVVMRVYWIAGLAAWRIIENMITRLIIRLLQNSTSVLYYIMKVFRIFRVFLYSRNLAIKQNKFFRAKMYFYLVIKPFHHVRLSIQIAEYKSRDSLNFTDARRKKNDDEKRYTFLSSRRYLMEQRRRLAGTPHLAFIK